MKQLLQSFIWASSVVFIIFYTSLALSAPGNRERQSRSGGAPAVSYSSNRSGMLFDLGYYYGQSEAVANPSPGNEWKDITSVYDIKLGYVFDSDLYLGGGYTVRTDSLTSLSVNSSSGGTAMLGIGWFWGTGFNLRGYYHIDESFGDYKSGTGFQADLGYMVNMTSNFYLGLLFSHRQTVYTSNSTIANFKSWTKKETFPMLTLGFLIN